MADTSDFDYSDVLAWVGKEQYTPQNTNPVERSEIRLFANITGDMNPLWYSDQYGAGTRWGGMIAPPHWLHAHDSAAWPGWVGKTSPANNLHAGTRWQFGRPVRPGDVIVVERNNFRVTEKRGGFADISILVQGDTIYTEERSGDHLGTVTTSIFRYPLSPQVVATAGPTRYEYTPTELATITAERDSWRPRGSDPLRFEDLAEGETLPIMILGPHTVTEFARHQLTYRLSEQTPTDTRNLRDPKLNKELGLDLFAASKDVHMEASQAKKGGVAAAYDFGPQRVAWLGKYFTDWFGDAGCLDSHDVRLRAPNLENDTNWVRATVLEKTEADDGYGRVRVDFKMTNQHNIDIATGTAEALLPKKV